MRAADALSHLGCKRVVWIDDEFAPTPQSLANAMTRNIEVARKCDFAELREAVSSVVYGEDQAREAITEKLAALPPERFNDITLAFRTEELAQEHAPAGELRASNIELACRLLGVPEESRWSFERATKELPDVCLGGDSDYAYIVDLKDFGGGARRGLDILRTLLVNKSLGIAFVLTHEAAIDGEVALEQELLAELEEENLAIPVCVVSKDRINSLDMSVVEAGLTICIKRASLRKTMHEVLAGAQREAANAVTDAAKKLLSIPPEDLETYVFERGYQEGVSELHVVERILTSHAGQQLRAYFGSDPEAKKNIQRLRALRQIKLDKVTRPKNEHLVSFRKAEVWEPRELLNLAYAPIACGDVFETDSEEPATAKISRRFLLLGQPCDMMLRPDGKRAHGTAFFIPLKKRQLGSEGNAKLVYFPFLLDGEQWACDFRNATSVNLDILDLASFREDGRVRFDEGALAPSDLLAPQQIVYAARTNAPLEAIAKQGQDSGGLQLCFSNGWPFDYSWTGFFVPALKSKPKNDPSDNLTRVTWRLRRFGRVREPYATSLLDQFLGTMNRPAFALDYMANADELVDPPVTAAVEDSHVEEANAPNSVRHGLFAAIRSWFH